MRWFKDMRLAVKLTAAFVVLALVVGVVGLLGRSATTDLTGQIAFLKDNSIVAMEELGEAELQIQAFRGATWKAMAMPDPKQRDAAWQEALEAVKAVEAAMERYRPTATLPGEKEQLDILQKVWGNVIAERQRAVDVRATSLDEAVRMMDNEVRQLDRQIRDGVAELSALNTREANERSAQMLDDAQSKGTQILVWAGLAMLGAIGLGMLLARHITGALGQVTTAAERIADGELDVKVDVDQNDEIGQLAKAQRKMVERLRSVIIEIQGVAEHVAAGSEQMTSSSDELSQGATRQSAAAEEASASVEEMSGSIAQNADNAAQTERIAQQTAQDAERSGTVVSKSVAAMHEIADKISIVERDRPPDQLVGVERRHRSRESW